MPGTERGERGVSDASWIAWSFGSAPRCGWQSRALAAEGSSESYTERVEVFSARRCEGQLQTACFEVCFGKRQLWFALVVYCWRSRWNRGRNFSRHLFPKVRHTTAVGSWITSRKCHCAYLYVPRDHTRCLTVLLF